MVKTKKKVKLINFKISLEDYEAIKQKAHLYEEGNISLWLRRQGKSDPSNSPATKETSYQKIEVPEEHWHLVTEAMDEVVYASNKKD